jgi:folate-binding protein YgfZ
MPVAHLQDRAILTISGPEAEHFLQNLITTDLSVLETDEVLPGALLSPQGKILFDFLISRLEPGGFRIDIRAVLASDFAKRLALYRLRAKVEIDELGAQPVAAIWDIFISGPNWDADPVLKGAFRDLRFALPVHRRYERLPRADAPIEQWDFYRMLFGIAESGSDYELGDAFPHDVLLDKIGGVGFTKGCYVGQEVVSRMQHRGTARRRIMIVDPVSYASGLPPAGTPLLAAGKRIGSLGQVIDDQALAIVRIDKVGEALAAGQPIMAGDVAVTLEFPEDMDLELPANPADAGAGNA